MRLTNLNQHVTAHARTALHPSSSSSAGGTSLPATPSLARAAAHPSSSMHDVPHHPARLGSSNNVWVPLPPPMASLASVRAVSPAAHPFHTESSVPSSSTLMSAASAATPAIDNPFESWFQHTKAAATPPVPKKPRRTFDSSDLSLLPPPPFLSASPSMSLGDCTDNEMEVDDDEDHDDDDNILSPERLRRHKAIVDAQLHFRCMELDCLLDCDIGLPPPPVLARAQAQMLLHHEAVAVACQKCGAVESITISY
ncbi:Aste57867_1004 [Aphanomyces stellatus]|uniref:Aste57867_1004 protein n=1 Tax=Aphanomyces stellatus TaxID=120398 RepID=A0A485K4C3_9STRA|nr:hypothetical protein As57867_001003 [Aphanomyces stellatus]VFT78226.1 Aste57867_1004 [Aphanomyces stellatus]